MGVVYACTRERHAVGHDEIFIVVASGNDDFVGGLCHVEGGLYGGVGSGTWRGSVRAEDE